MRIWNIATAFIGVTIGTIVTIVGWLFWPLPNAEFDWHTYANEMADEGSCAEFVELLLGISVTDPEGLENFLGEQSLFDRCPMEDENKPGRGAALAAEQTSEIESMIAFHYRRPDLSMGTERSLQEASWFWEAGRRLRSYSFTGRIAWPDLVIGFRCLRPLKYGPSSNWYSVRRGNAYTTSRPTHIAAWEARYAWCRNYVLHEAAKLDDDFGKNQSYQERADRYRRFANMLPARPE